MKKYELSEVSQIEPKVGERFIIVYDGNEFEFKPFYYEDDTIIEPDMVAGYNVFYNGEYIRNWNDPELDPDNLETQLFAEIERNIIKPRQNKGKADELNAIALDARQKIVEVISSVLKGKRKKLAIDVTFASDCDEDRYSVTNVVSVRKNTKGEIMLHCECEGDEYDEDIMLYSFDEIYKIAMAVVSKC